MSQPVCLVIDDDALVVELVRLALQPADLRVVAEHTGRGGLRAHRRVRPDLVILDLMLPGMDGLGVCWNLRGEAGKDTPLLMLTARDTLEDKIAGLDAGADDYLVKPFEIEELEAAIQEFLDTGNQHPKPFEWTKRPTRSSRAWHACDTEPSTTGHRRRNSWFGLASRETSSRPTTRLRAPPTPCRALRPPLVPRLEPCSIHGLARGSLPR